MSDLPEGWAETNLGEVAVWGSGGTPSRSKSSYFGGSIPWLKTGELGPKYIWSVEETISVEGLNKSSAKLFPTGSVAIAMYGATIGRTSIFAIDTSTNQACAVAQPIENTLFNEFLYYFLLSVKKKLIDSGKGGAQPNISQGVLKAFPLSLPPLNEQKRIVAKIEELLSELDAGVAALKQAREKLKVYRQAVLKAAFEGWLTESWRKEHADELESADKLLARIRAEREARYQERLAEWQRAVAEWETVGKPGKKPTKPRKPKELPPLTAEELADLPELPDGWGWGKLGECSDIVGGVTKGRNLSGKETISLPYLRVANVQDGYLDLRELKLIDVLPEDLNKYRLEYGDILYIEGGDKDKLGRGTLWKNEVSNCIHQNHVFRARLVGGFFEPKFVALISQAQTAKRYFFKNAKQTVNLASVNMTVLSGLPIQIVPIEEQQQIVQEIESRFSAVEQMEQAVDEGLKKAEALRQSILKQAFTGKLVPQDPSDEPASELLARIRAEREAA
jgi:type I restriction enzyme S subunit